MPSSVKQTVLSVSVFAVGVAFVSWGATTRRPAAPEPPVHHLIGPPAESVAAPPADPGVLRVCADPNNLPFSDRAQAGFENRLAELVGRELHRAVAYYWQPQRRGFIRTTLNAGMCDLVMGVPTSSDMVRTTRPYYRSSYVFVSKHGLRPPISSFDDPRLRRLRIGIPMTGDDGGNPPPAMALAKRHIFGNVGGYPVYGDYSQPRPSWGVLDALLKGEVDVAIAWGPQAGYFARQAPTPVDLVNLPFTFDMSMGREVRGQRAVTAANARSA